MKLIILLSLLVGIFAVNQTAGAAGTPYMVCYYDTSSFIREGLGKLIYNDLEPALQFCTHLVYGYAKINPGTFKLESKNENLDLDSGKGLYRIITSIKRKYPGLKVILSVGGDKDIDEDNPDKYLTLLESSSNRIAFINSAHALVKTYSFDGLDLSWQFRKNKPKKHHGTIAKAWKSFKKVFTGDQVVDEKAEDHKKDFKTLVADLRNAFRPEGFLLSLTVLPNVNSSWYFDIPAIVNNLDFVNLAAFDFSTPERYPKQADIPAPIYEMNDRHPEHNVNYQVQYWLNNHCPATKINVGVPTFGRAWKMTEDSGLTGHPPVDETDDAAEAGSQSLSPGLLSWPEICSKLRNPSNAHLKGADAPLRKVNDASKRTGTYAYRSTEDGEHGLWIGYEDPDTAANKAAYVKTKGLGGVALFDLCYDDFRGTCTGDKYPILRAAKYRLMAQ